MAAMALAGYIAEHISTPLAMVLGFAAIGFVFTGLANLGGVR